MPVPSTRFLSHAVKTALVLLMDEGEAILSGNFWRAPSGRRIVFRTVENMFSRSLVVIIYPHRPVKGHKKVTDDTRAKHSVRLTEIGTFLARGIKVEWNDNPGALTADDWEISPLVYESEAVS